MKKILAASFIFLGLSACLYIVWIEEFQYYIPIENYNQTELPSSFDFHWLNQRPERPVFLHFYIENCRTARINVDHIERFMTKYKSDFEFYLVNQSNKSSTEIEETLELPSFIQIIPDPEGKIFNYFHIQSTPHALVLQPNGQTYFSGNYNNQNGLCGPADIQWSAPAIALKFLKNNSNPPIFPAYQTVPRGCDIQKL